MPDGGYFNRNLANNNTNKETAMTGMHATDTFLLENIGGNASHLMLTVRERGPATCEVGLAFCSKKDRFISERGRHIAYGRMGAKPIIVRKEKMVQVLAALAVFKGERLALTPSVVLTMLGCKVERPAQLIKKPRQTKS